MKNPKRLTREEKIILWKRNLNSKDFLKLSESDEKYEFIEVSSGKILTIYKCELSKKK